MTQTDKDVDASTVAETSVEPSEVIVKPKRKTCKNTLRQDVLRRLFNQKTLDYYGMLKVDVTQGIYKANVVIPSIRRLEEYISYQVENLTYHPIFTKISFKNPVLEYEQSALFNGSIVDFHVGVVNAFGKETRRGIQIAVSIKVSFSPAGHMQINVTC